LAGTPRWIHPDSRTGSFSESAAGLRLSGCSYTRLEKSSALCAMRREAACFLSVASISGVASASDFTIAGFTSVTSITW